MNDWLVVRRNIIKVFQVWGRLGVILRREVVYPITSAAFYRAVVQSVLLFRAEIWVFSAAMEKRIVGFHMTFCGR